MILNWLRVGRKLKAFYIFKLLLYVAVIASSVIVVWKFSDECFHIPFPPNSFAKKCIEGRSNKPREYNIEISYKNALAVDLLHPHQSYSQRLLRNLRNADKSSKLQEKSHIVDTLSTTEDGGTNGASGDTESRGEMEREIPETFKNRTARSQKACSAYIYDEESINFNIEDSAEFLQEMKKLERLEKGESKLFLKTNPQKRNRWIFYNHNQKGSRMKIQWCPIYKSASTSWMAIFTKLVGALTDTTTAKIHQGKMTFVDLAKNFRLFFPSTQRSFDKPPIPTYSMIVVRHPFKRLLSAYQDKIERVKGREYFHKMYGKKIVKYFRGRMKLETKSGTTENVPEWYRMALINSQSTSSKTNQRDSSIDPPFLKESKGRRALANLLNSSSLLAPQAMKREEIKLMLAHKHDVPTFSEFCSYLITVDPRDMNEHWRPQYLDCSPCHHKFDLFLKVETLERDKDEVFKILGYDNSTNEAYKEMEATWRQWSNPSSKANNEEFYYSQLNKKLIERLYDIYELDFQLFGYSAKEYLRMVQ